MPGTIQACVFDAYGTLLDVAAAAVRCRDALGEKTEPLARLWRTKQLEYTWLRSLMGRYADFWQVTGDALDFALDHFQLQDAGLRQRLMDLYWRLDAYPDAKAALEASRARGLKCAVLSNASPSMLNEALGHAGLSPLLDAVLSVDGLSIYKPHPTVYDLAVTELGVPAGRMLFLSANGWDIAGAASRGCRTVWVNRMGLPRDRLPAGPEREIRSLAGLSGLLQEL